MAEHEEMGKELYQMSKRLGLISTQILNSYGVSKKVSNKARKAAEALDDLRCELENRMRDDCKEASDPDVVRTYYPGSHLED